MLIVLYSSSESLESIILCKHFMRFLIKFFLFIIYVNFSFFFLFKKIERSVLIFWKLDDSKEYSLQINLEFLFKSIPNNFLT